MDFKELRDLTHETDTSESQVPGREQKDKKCSGSISHILSSWSTVG